MSARTVVSYVRRSPRMTKSQAASLTRNSACYLVDGLAREPSREPQFAPQPPLDWASVFGRVAEIVVEVGMGAGETLVAAAIAHPELNFVGFEVFERALAATMIRLEAQGATNVRLVHGDALSGLEYLFQPHSISEVWTFFPDPWPKARHAKRRLVNPEFASLVASRLVKDGLWRLATDWDDYAEHINEVMHSNVVGSDVMQRDPLQGDVVQNNVIRSQSNFELLNTRRFALRPLTKFEGRGIAAGRTIHDFCYRAVATAASLAHREGLSA